MDIATDDFIEFCINQHDIECNQKYDDNLPYSFHLKAVASQVDIFKHLIPFHQMYRVKCGAVGHDLIEDARCTYNDVVNKSDKVVADIIYCCTDEKGRNRAERHNAKFYKELAENDLAVFVKVCDIIANVKYSMLTNSSMYKTYGKEFSKMKSYLYKEKYKEMFDYLEKLITL